MPVLLHDSAVRTSIEKRVLALAPTARGRWGKMSVDQMLWHVNEAMAAAIGERDQPPGKPLLPRGVMKFIVLRAPWTKGAPTLPDLVARANHDFAAERTRCIRLIGAIVEKPIGGVWQDDHPLFGTMTGIDVSRLHAKHLDHHLKQFGV